jgi:hypothetical protein
MLSDVVDPEGLPYQADGSAREERAGTQAGEQAEEQAEQQAVEQAGTQNEPQVEVCLSVRPYLVWAGKEAESGGRLDRGDEWERVPVELRVVCQ